jgi:DNA-binding MarR family transcriptional regulator
MKLEEIFVYLIERTERQMKRYANEALKRAGIEISSEQWVILKRISEQEIINQRELAALTFKDPASVTRTLDILEKDGLIRRMPVENDRRAYNLVLTGAGEALVQQIIPIAEAVRAHGLRNIPDEELRMFKSTLNKIYENYT